MAPPLLVALGIAFALGFRHASDPDHLVAVTSLVAADDGGTARRHAPRAPGGALATRPCWSLLGVPLIVFKSALPGWLEGGAEKAVGVVIIVLALRVTWKWARGDYRAGRHPHSTGDAVPQRGPHRHLRRRRGRRHPPPPTRANSAAGIRHRPAPRARRDRRGRRAAARRAAHPARGGARASRSSRR